MRMLPLLLLATTTVAIPATAFGAPVPPITVERNDAAVIAFATVHFLDESVKACVEDAPLVAGRVEASATGWLERNTDAAAAAAMWLEHVVQTTAGGDPAKVESLAAEVAEVVSVVQQPLIDKAFGEIGLNGLTCMQLALAMDAREYDLLENAKTAAALRELVAIGWPEQ